MDVAAGFALMDLVVIMDLAYFVGGGGEIAISGQADMQNYSADNRGSRDGLVT